MGRRVKSKRYYRLDGSFGITRTVEDLKNYVTPVTKMMSHLCRADRRLIKN